MATARQLHSSLESARRDSRISVPCVLTGLALSVTNVLAPVPAAAQTVRGTVVDAESRGRLVDTIVRLLAADSQTIVTTVSDDSGRFELRAPQAGRVAAVSFVFISASNELGEARGGFAAAWLGPVAATVAGGVAAVVVTLIWAYWFPELRRARTFDIPEEPPPEEATVVAGGA